MTNPINNIQRIGGQTFGNDDFFEVRIENDSAGNPLYIGRSPIANANTALNVWFITKLYYDANVFLNRVQQPDNGSAFIYAWDDRATYFS
jgi:hypothetical protein